MKNNGDMVKFLRQKDYVMINNMLGHGSFGQTVLLQDPDLKELFVAKKYEPRCPEDQEPFFKTFQQEIKIMYKLNHRNVVRVFNYYIYDEAHTGYILMEYIDGENIADHMHDEIPWDNSWLDGIFLQLVDGFRYIEENNIIHRDIREGNILVDKNDVVKIIDFGLGKIFKPVEISAQDSMNAIINRSGLDLLPEEYFKGEYDSQTDMFYLAELFHRLLRKESLTDSFSYSAILTKMMAEKKAERYASFAEVKEAIGKKDFFSLAISQKDKDIYQNFANGLYNCLSSFTEERQFNLNAAEFLKRLDAIQEKNCFEDVIQNNADLLSCIIESSYRYNAKYEIKVETLKAFREWLVSLNAKTQELVLNNISYKLSCVKTKLPEDNIPF